MSAETKGMILGILGVTCFGFGFGFGLTLPATRLIISLFEPVFIDLERGDLASFVAANLLKVTKQTRLGLRQFYQLWE